MSLNIHSFVLLLFISADPGHVSMYISPRMSGNLYSVNESVRFRCSADVGNPPQNRPWSWQWNYLVDTNIWESYPYTNRIKDAPVQPGSCKNYGSSTLTHIVTAKDNGRIIRCVINNNTLYSEKFLFYRSKIIIVVINYCLSYILICLHMYISIV